MKGVIVLILVVIILISGAGCESVETINQTTSSNTDVQKQIDELNKQVSELKTQVDGLKQTNDKLEKENSELKTQVEGYTPKAINATLDLKSWTSDDIFNKYKETDSVFQLAGWYTYEYSGETLYSKFDQQFYGKDEFSEIAYKKQDRELNVSHLRMFKLGYKSSVEQEEQDYLDLISTKSSIDRSLQCTTSLDCRDVKVIRCVKNGKKLFAWFADGWLFSAIDNGYALEIFKKFYC